MAILTLRELLLVLCCSSLAFGQLESGTTISDGSPDVTTAPSGHDADADPHTAAAPMTTVPPTSGNSPPETTEGSADGSAVETTENRDTEEGSGHTAGDSHPSTTADVAHHATDATTLAATTTAATEAAPSSAAPVITIPSVSPEGDTPDHVSTPAPPHTDEVVEDTTTSSPAEESHTTTSASTVHEEPATEPTAREVTSHVPAAPSTAPETVTSEPSTAAPATVTEPPEEEQPTTEPQETTEKADEGHDEAHTTSDHEHPSTAHTPSPTPSPTESGDATSSAPTETPSEDLAPRTTTEGTRDETPSEHEGHQDPSASPEPSPVTTRATSEPRPGDVETSSVAPSTSEVSVAGSSSCFGDAEINTILVVAVVVGVNVLSIVVTALCVHRIVSRRLSWDPPPIYYNRSKRPAPRPDQPRSGLNLASDTDCKAGEAGSPTHIPILITNEDGWCVPYTDQDQKKKKDAATTATEDTGV